MPKQEPSTAPAIKPGHVAHARTLDQRESVVINIFRALFALGSFVLKTAVDQGQQEPLQLQTRIIGAAFFCILSIIPLRHSRGHGGPPLSTDIQSTAGRQLISSRKSRMLALYLILWWYACRAVPSIQSRVAASPVANDAYLRYNQLLEKLSEMFCNDDRDERQREIDAVVEQRIEEERLHFRSIQSKLVAKEKSARFLVEQRDEMKRNMDAIRHEYEEKTNATKSMEEKLRNEIASLVEARDELQRQALAAKQKHNEELARARDEKIQTQEILKQTKAEKQILEKTVHDAKVLLDTLKEENKDTHLEAENITRKLETTQDELAACIAARARRGLFRRRGGKNFTPTPEIKTANVWQSALLEIWSTSDWLFALF